jgi:hypothetical protein
VVGVGSGIDVAEGKGVGGAVAVGVGVAEGKGVGVGVAVGVAVAEGVGGAVAVGVAVAEGIGVGVAVGVGVAEGVGIGVAVGVGVAEGVGVAGLQAKSNAPMESKSGPNSSLFILYEWGRNDAFGPCRARLIQVLGNNSSLFIVFRPRPTSAAPLLRGLIRQDVVPLFEKFEDFRPLVKSGGQLRLSRRRCNRKCPV